MAPKDGTQGQPSSNKRKGPPSVPSDGWRSKRQKTQRDSRTLAVQTTSKAFKNGELDVGAFVKAREYEIRALEEGLARSKKGLTQRAFQQVPKELRRRTASHNAKRVPKRLRKQAVKEMADDNTPTVTARRRKPTRHMRLRMETVKRLRALGSKKKAAMDSNVVADGVTKDPIAGQGLKAADSTGTIVTRQPKVKKNTLNTAPIPQSKFRKRQIHKTWLPTHIFHAKRAHMTPPMEPLWRFSIPLTSTAKSYRPTHRASGERGAVAWDASYMSCISLQGVEGSIQGVLKGLSVGSPDDSSAPWGAKGLKWRNGTRVWNGWLYERDMYPLKPICPATVVWRTEASKDLRSDKVQQATTDAPNTKQGDRQVFIRCHPSAFMQIWEQIIRLAKVQKPQVVVEDLRFDIGSIEITGPGSSEALLGALRPAGSAPGDARQGSLETVLTALAGATNPGVLPSNCLLTFDIADPRLGQSNTAETILPKDSTDLYSILANWPSDAVLQSQGLFDRKKRLAASRALPTQKSVNRRKAMAEPGSPPEPLPQDPRIPVLMYPVFQAPLEKRSGLGRQATWVLLLPWKAVPVVWQSIMFHPLSSGGQVRLGGLQEKRQVEFENGQPWFPGDFPGTQAGQAWEVTENARRTKEWERRPKGKRTEWSSVNLGPGRKGEIGNGNTCDWATLVAGSAPAADVSTMPHQEQRQTASLYHLSSTTARSLFADSVKAMTPTKDLDNALATVRLVLLTRGVPSPCARIYRLPTGKEAEKETTPISSSRATKSLRAQWLALRPTRSNNNNKLDMPRKNKHTLPNSTGYRKGLGEASAQQALAADLLQPPALTASGNSKKFDNESLEIPGEEDLIGFVTTGEFCLTEGKGVGVGSVLVGRVMETRRQRDGEGKSAERASGSGVERLCIVRNAGDTVGRLAEWVVV